jgi:hypothetical protein
MKSYETSATVEAEGEIRLIGVPFEPGTEVAVSISLKGDLATAPRSGAVDPIAQLLMALDKAHNSHPIGSLRRDELYDRNDLH